MLLERVDILDLISKVKYVWLVTNLSEKEELKCLMIPGQLQQHHQFVVKMVAKIQLVQMQCPAFNWIISIPRPKMVLPIRFDHR